jgi:hypothetical protein
MVAPRRGSVPDGTAVGSPGFQGRQEFLDALFALRDPASPKETCRPWRGYGLRGAPCFPGAYAAGLLPIALRAGGSPPSQVPSESRGVLRSGCGRPIRGSSRARRVAGQGRRVAPLFPSIVSLGRASARPSFIHPDFPPKRLEYRSGVLPRRSDGLDGDTTLQRWIRRLVARVSRTPSRDVGLRTGTTLWKAIRRPGFPP